ncbi:MAG: carboxynorspermidine decarboxylase [Desulfomicrobiaceae bacterium]|jgi:carboxynorspermidine decarboxylase|nr:carboxynorspermidine decarboxylase [Desulfomicrobiaceae bacterium]MBZ4684543.1 carboxynorspermidine decarboxylase [Desulfomicrobiaceae bacterium]MDI3493180.1 carboxynorspermidine decarboxylase [Desulfomicrobiaceae bacterium]MDK2872769.1 carboxynorspermidine decarboxylase [Desulfomicrobiaceae bacterium]HCF05710.1 carboxynorspermidine decarboxylase [Desulfomicrobiaceae bacterium]
MDGRTQFRFDATAVETPCFVVDTGLLARNLEILAAVKARTGCKILLALKGFAMWSVFAQLREVLDGVCASSPHEARLGREEFGGEVHAFAAAYSEAHVRALCATADHVVFNSFGQLTRLGPVVEEECARLGRQVRLGIRINPEHSEGTVPIYDPCSPGSRLGVRRRHFRPELLDGVSGLHWHTLCEQNADSLERTVAAAEAAFGEFFSRMEYVNFGGGHHITRADYDIALLCRIITDFQDRYGVQVYLEPGEAVALNTGYLVTTVLDLIEADMPMAILDTAVPAHMPDVLEMPYRPHIVGSGEPFEKPYTYRLGGLSCLAGDVAGEYSFDAPLHLGQRLVFTDMAHYSMVKTNTFNGVGLPSIYTFHPGRGLQLVRRFGYEDFKGRLS